MDRTEFDRFADEYRAMHGANITASGENPEYFADYKMRDFSAIVDRRSLPRDGHYLDFGAGTGNSIPHFSTHLPDARLLGLDVSSRSLEVARTRFGEAAALAVFDGRTLPFSDATFDGAFSCCVFHHVPSELHVPLLAELRRVIRPGGVVMIYEHNPLNPLTVRAVNTCPFDANAVLIGATTMTERVRAAGFADVRHRFRVFFPRSLRALRPLEARLGWNPLGAQYYALGIR